MLEPFENICRLCAKQKEQLISLFSYDKYRNIQLVEEIMNFTSIEIRFDDKLPKMVCNGCIECLHSALNFKMLCQESQNKLEQIISPATAFEMKGLKELFHSFTDQHADLKIKNETIIIHNSNYSQNKGNYIKTFSNNQYEEIDANKLTLNLKGIEKNQKMKENRGALKQDIEITDNDLSSEKDTDVTFRKIQKKKNRYTRYMCETCGRVYHDKCSLQIHIRFHTGERPFVCNICEKSFAAKANLKTHMRMHSGEKPYICGTCGRSFSTSASLHCHSRTHTGEKPFDCKTCSRTFANRSNLRTHIRIHTGDKPHVCNICGKAFCSSSDLATHNRSHSGEKPFSCQLCPKRFSLASNLTTHKRIHTGEKNFQCEICERYFISKASLKIHMRTHTGDRPFTCMICDKKFTHSNTLSAHKISHMGVRNFQCEICNKKFARSSSLKAHKKKHFIAQ